jgi:hypothetical protein
LCPRANLDAVEKRKTLPCRKWNSGRQSHKPSLYRLSYPDSITYAMHLQFSFVLGLVCMFFFLCNEHAFTYNRLTYCNCVYHYFVYSFERSLSEPQVCHWFRHWPTTMLWTTGQALAQDKGLLCADFCIHTTLELNLFPSTCISSPMLRRVTCFIVHISVFLVLLKMEATISSRSDCSYVPGHTIYSESLMLRSVIMK